MPLVNNSFYQDVGISLENTYQNKQNHRYLYQQRYFDPAKQNFLAPVTPLYTEFWGPKVMSILIVGRNYGWVGGVEQWPPLGFEQSKQTIKDSFVKWVQYKVMVWVDRVLLNRVMEASPDSEFSNQMTQVIARVTALCAEMGDFGFEYMGTLDEGKDASFFKPYIEEFWKK